MEIELQAITSVGTKAHDLQEADFAKQPIEQRRMFKKMGYELRRRSVRQLVIIMHQKDTFSLVEQITDQVRTAYKEYGATEEKDYRIKITT